jgi:peptidoglycan/LPS O-acetylase OafA/YrhL
MSQPEAAEPAVAAEAAPRITHIDGLDGLRGVFVLLIVAWHGFLTLGSPSATASAGPVPGAFIGVDLFFVLSGFLITSLLLHEQRRAGGRIRFGSFYRRRALRLLPALVVLLAVYSYYSFVAGFEWDHVKTSILPVLFYYSNWANVASNYQDLARGLSHTWSLAVEEQFYLVWPLVLVLLLGIRRRLSTVTTVLLAALVLVELNRLRIFWSHDSLAKLDILYRTDTRCDGLLIGALVAQWWVRGRLPRRGLALGAWISVIFLAYCVHFYGGSSDFYFVGGFALVAIAGALVVAATVNSDWRGRHIAMWRPLAALGVVSYGVYLWHMTVFVVVQHEGPTWSTPVRVTVAFTATAALTLLSWFVVERPFLAYKSRLEARRRAGRQVSVSDRPQVNAELSPAVPGAKAT